MAINPDNITTIRVDQLAPATLDLTKLIPVAETNGDLKQSSIQALANLIATTIEASGGVGYIAISISDGQQLPDVPENPSFFLAGAGTYLNINGYPNIICTDELNAIMSLEDHWELAVGIPIVAEVGVQTVTGSAVDNTDPLNPVINSTGGGGVPTLDEVLGEGNTATDKTLGIYDSVSTDDAILGYNLLSFYDASENSGIEYMVNKIRRYFGSQQVEVEFTTPTGTTGKILFPDVVNATKTLATLDDIPSTSTFVPYTGATADVDLDAFSLNAKSLHVKGTGGAGHLGLKHQSSNISASASESSLGANSSGNPIWKNASNAIQNILTNDNIVETITNGVTDKAPSENAVFDALALKQNVVSGVSDTEIGYLDGVTSAIQTQLNNRTLNIIKRATASSAVTGTTVESILTTDEIVGNTFSTNDILQLVSARFIKTGALGTCTYRVRINTTNSLSGAVTIATLSNANVYAKIGNRTFTITGGNIRGYNFTDNGISSGQDTGSASLAEASTAYNPVNSIFIFTTAQLANGGDSTICREFLITN